MILRACLATMAVLGLASPARAEQDQPMAHEHGAMMPGMPAPQSEPHDPVADSPAPPVAADHAADAFFPAARMAAARAALMQEDRISYAQVLIERLELRAFGDKAGLNWEGEASTGSDRDRLVFATQGEGRAGDPLDRAELHAKWRHAIDPWFNVEVGLRHDLRPDPQRTYLLIGVEGLAPYWIDTEAQVFFSDKGDVHARVEAAFDQRITQRWVLRPATEVNIAFQSVQELGITRRVPEWSAGARLRYEIKPNLAPYVGFEWRHDPSPAKGTDRAGVRTSGDVLVGISAWF